MRACCLLALAACGASARPATSSTTSGGTSRSGVAPEAIGSRVLLVVTGYSSAEDEIAAPALAKGYCSGAIAVLEPVRAVADEHFQCKGTPVDELRTFIPSAKTRLLVTDLDHVTAQLKALPVDGVSFFARPAEYPLVLGTPRPSFRPHLTHFIMTGVTAITRATGAACDQKGIAWLTQNLRRHFEDADFVHISNEVSIKADCKYPVKGTYQFCTKESDFQALLDLHANIVELTGNHTRDFGDEPFRRTMDWYKAHDMKTFGGGLTPEQANEPVIVPLAGGKKLGIIGFNEQCPLKECALKPNEVGANAWDSAKARAAIARMRDELGADFIIVTVQSKEVDSAEPTRTQSAISRELIDNGADLVYGSQAHQLQLVEFYHGKPIFHGLGNFMFDQIHRIGVRQAFFLHHYFFHGKLVQSVPVFTFMSDERQPTLATPEQAAVMKDLIFRDELLYSFGSSGR